MWYVYVLFCEDGSLYTGVSNNVEKRFISHLLGKGAKYTQAHKPIKIVHQECLATRSDALKREHTIKSWPRRKKVAALGLNI